MDLSTFETSGQAGPDPRLRSSRKNAIIRPGEKRAPSAQERYRQHLSSIEPLAHAIPGLSHPARDEDSAIARRAPYERDQTLPLGVEQDLVDEPLRESGIAGSPRLAPVVAAKNARPLGAEEDGSARLRDHRVHDQLLGRDPRPRAAVVFADPESFGRAGEKHTRVILGERGRPPAGMGDPG